MEEERVRIEDYAHSPAHYAVALGDMTRLNRLLSALPQLAHPSQILTESDSVVQERIADEIAAVVDRRDVPRRDTPLHLAVRLDRPAGASALAAAGADPSLQNASGWTPLQEALCLRRRRLALLLLRHHRLSAWSKFRRRLPPLLAALRRVPDFYLELAFHFESSLLPFLSRAAPSDTYRIWKRGADLRADTSLAGFDGLRVRRADQSFLFLGSGSGSGGGGAAPSHLPPGSLLVLDRARKEIHDAFEGADSPSPGPDESDIVADASAYRPGLDITAAELVGRTNWRRREKTEMVGEWRARVYEIHNVVFSFKTMKAVEEAEEEFLPLELREDDEEGFLVAEIPDLPPRHSCYERGKFGNRVPEGRETGRRRSVDVPHQGGAAMAARVGKSKEKEMVKSLRPTVWLTEDFPLKVEELLPLLDILANKVKAVRRLRELLTTKFPPGTFPVKVAIPIVPTVRVVVTFTKFVDLQPPEQFFTPLSSPRLFSVPEEEEHHKAEKHKSSWLKWSNTTAKTSVTRPKSVSASQVVDHVDPFTIPSDYTWVDINSKNRRLKKSKSRKGNQKETR
ncbi:uncharacterized protein [Elaeis guineensis]